MPSVTKPKIQGLRNILNDPVAKLLSTITESLFHECPRDVFYEMLLEGLDLVGEVHLPFPCRPVENKEEGVEVRPSVAFGECQVLPPLHSNTTTFEKLHVEKLHGVISYLFLLSRRRD